MNYYIDGNFEELNISSGEKCYSSSYSCEKHNFHNITLVPDIQKKINYSTFDEIVDFYNSNEYYFKSFEKKYGVDVWFFEQFRIYFSYRNFFLRLACIRQFLDNYPTGKIITADTRLANFLAKESIEIVQENKALIKKQSLIKEFLFVLGKAKFSYSQKHDHLILSRIEDDVNGIDQRLGKLEPYCDKMLNRESFNLAKKVPKENKLYARNSNVDQILGGYLFGVKWLFHLNAFRKGLRQLTDDLNLNKRANNKESLIIMDLFRKNTMSYYVYYLRYKAFQRFFKKTSYKTISFINENSAQQKALQYASVGQGIKVHGIQHGTIHDLHPAYIYKGYKTPPLLPDITFSWGEHFTEMLCKNGYRNDQVVTSGRLPSVIAHDKLNHVLVGKSNILVYATQPQRDEALRQRQLHDVFRAVKHTKSNYFLVIRPHPNEKDDTYFTQVAEAHEFDNYIIDRDSDLEMHFKSCQALITSFSTVGVEFVPHFKPLLVLDYTKADLIGYIHEGVGIQIEDYNKLVSVLDNELLIDVIKNEEFMRNYLFDNGNSATEIVLKKMQDSI